MPAVNLLQRSPSASGGATSYASYIFNLPNPTQANNLIVVAGQYGTNASITSLTVSDDAGNSYSNAITNSTEAGSQNQTAFIYYVAGCKAGARQITITYNGANATFQDAWAAEFCGIATSSALDTTNHNSAASNTVQAGSITPAQSGDLLVMMCEQDSQGTVQGWAAGSQSNINWALCDADRGYGNSICQAVQWGVYNSTAAINPQMTKTDSNTGQYNAVVAAFKADSTKGSNELSGRVYIKDVSHYNLVSTGTSVVTQATIPPQCNWIAFSMISEANQDVTAVTDSHSNTWTHAGLKADVSGSGDVDFWYAANATCSQDMSLTLTISGSGLADADMVIYGIDNVGSYDSVVGVFSASGTNSANPLSSASVTPSRSGGVVLAACGINNGLIESLVAPGQADISYSAQEGSIGEMDERNGKGHYYPLNTNSFTFSWNNSGATLNGWLCTGISLLPQQPNLLGIGAVGM